jgi:uncharacterized protein YjbJ (UPF0337 family)
MEDNDRDVNRPIDDDIRDDDPNLGRQGMGDKLKGEANETIGGLQKKAGEVTNNKDMEAEGEGRELKGKFQQGLGDAKRAADDLLDH